MDRKAAQTLIENTFNYPFDEDRFRYFAINLLTNLDKEKDSPYISGKYIKDFFREHVHKYRRIGTFVAPDGDKLDVLVVHLVNPWALERSRTMLRNFTAWYLKNQDEKDAALVAYHTDDLDDWRFSFVRMEYRHEITEKGTIKVKEEFTPARRYSYLVGKNEPNHTAQEQMIPILEDDQDNPTLTDIEAAFSVDAVTKQFYKDYRALFEKLTNELKNILKKDNKIKKEFENKSIDTANFSKKLMGQIVFLYFLQKKGWLGVSKDNQGNFKRWGTGPKNFMKRLFNREFSDYKNFFNDILEPLFYNALNNGDRRSDYYEKLDCKIPFLDGGLFDPMNDYDWVETEMRINNDIFKNILKTFDRYNFTVREDEPLDKEVAVDPEMLGKVFENLLPENLRKGKGAYYTPRPIVHYICQESLINYLAAECEAYVPKDDIEKLILKGEIAVEVEAAIKEGTKSYKCQIPETVRQRAALIDEKLAGIKVCDPAVGSGAFPVGIMNEIVKARLILDTFLRLEKTIYDFKRHCIQESLYGVDIDPGAIQIAKLRLWLSLVVDEDDYETIQPLPNLDFKIMQGNSLIEEFHGISLEIEKQKQLELGNDVVKLDQLIKDLHQKQEKFFNAIHPNEKQQRKKDVEEAIFNIFRHQVRNKKQFDPEEAAKIEAKLIEMTQSNKPRYFFPWKLYFADVFRKNGGFHIVIANPPYINAIELKKTTDPEILKRYKENFITAKGAADIYIYFFELGLKILQSFGTLCYISPNKYLSAPYGSALRSLILDHSEIDKFINVSQIPVFDEASVYPIISFICKGKKRQMFRSINLPTNTLFDLERRNLTLITYPNSVLQEFPNYIWGFVLHGNYEILKKIKNKSIPLANIGLIRATSTASEADLFSDDIFNKTREKAFKLVNTGTIDRYSTTWGVKPLRNKGDLFLTPFLQLNKDLTDYRIEMYNSPKLLFAKMAKKTEVFADCVGEYASINTNCLYKLNSKYQLLYVGGFCNSKLFQFVYSQYFGGSRMSGGYYQFQAPQLRLMPIFDAATATQMKISSIVRKLIDAKKNDALRDANSLESEIDHIIYDLYELTDKEIAIVEDNVT